MQLHFFGSTNEAYEAVQCDEGIHTGDLLVIAAEQVVGVAATWPVAVSRKCGELHSVADVETFATPKNAEAKGMSAAIELARLLGW